MNLLGTYLASNVTGTAANYDWFHDGGTTVTKYTASISVQAGDLLVVLGAAEACTRQFSFSDSDGNTWSKYYDSNDDGGDGGDPYVVSASAVCANTTSLVVTGTVSISGVWSCGFRVLHYRDAAIGATAGTHPITNGAGIDITTQHDNSHVAMVAFDWSAVGGNTYHTADCGAFTELDYGNNATYGSVYVGYYASPGVAAAGETVGLSSPSSGVIYGYAVVEIYNTGAEATPSIRRVARFVGGAA